MSKVTLKCFKSLHLKQQYIPKSAKSSKYSTVTLPRPFRDMVKVNTEVNEFFSTNTVVPQLKHLMLNPKFTSAFHPTHSKLLTWMYRLPFQIMEFVDPSVKHLSSPINIKRQDPRGGGGRKAWSPLCNNYFLAAEKSDTFQGRTSGKRQLWETRVAMEYASSKQWWPTDHQAAVVFSQQLSNWVSKFQTVLNPPSLSFLPL